MLSVLERVRYSGPVSGVRQANSLVVYRGALYIWPLLWAFVVDPNVLRTDRLTWIGLLYPLVLLGLDAWLESNNDASTKQQGGDGCESSTSTSTFNTFATLAFAFVGFFATTGVNGKAFVKSSTPILGL